MLPISIMPNRFYVFLFVFYVEVFCNSLGVPQYLGNIVCEIMFPDILLLFTSFWFDLLIQYEFCFWKAFELNLLCPSALELTVIENRNIASNVACCWNTFMVLSHQMDLKQTVQYILILLEKHPELADYLTSILPPPVGASALSHNAVAHTLHSVAVNSEHSLPDSKWVAWSVLLAAWSEHIIGSMSIL